MSDAKLLEVLNAYKAWLANSNIEPTKMPDDYLSQHQCDSVAMAHVAWMINESIQFVLNNERAKADRWLGFIQGVMWMMRVFTVEQLRDHSRPAEKGGNPLKPTDEPQRTYGLLLARQLRDRTDLPFLECRRLLERAKWNVDDAVELAHEDRLKDRRFGIMDGPH